MAVKTWNCSFKVMNVCGSTGNVITSIREKYSSIPSHNNEAGVGGTGSKESKPNNSTFIRFDGLNTQIPKGAKIESAVLSWTVNHADWKKAVTHKIQGCANFSNTLSGINQPTLSGPIATYNLPEHSVTSGYPFTADITSVIQHLVNNNLYCVKVFISAGENRKYLNAACTLTVTYSATTGVPGLFLTNSDCNSGYAHKEVTVQAQKPTGQESETIYFQYKIVNENQSWSSKWTTDTQCVVPILGSAGSVNNITVLSSFFVDGQLPTTSAPITITKNLTPTLSFSTISSSNLIINGNQVIVNGNASFKAVATDSSLKKDTVGILKFIVNGAVVETYNGLTNNFSYNFASGKTYSVYSEFSDGFITTRSTTFTVKGASPLKIELTGEPLIVSKYRCDTVTNITATATSLDTGVAINSLVINAYKIEAGIQTLISSKSGAVSPQVLALTIPSYTTANSEIQFIFTVTAKSTINQEYTISSKPVIINRKCTMVSGLVTRRKTPDIFGNSSDIEDSLNGYPNFFVPNQDIVTFEWTPSSDSDISDIIKYQITASQWADEVSVNSYDYEYGFSGLNQSTQIAIAASDGYNLTPASSKIVYGANEILTTPEITLKCYEPYLGSGTPISINGNQVVDVTSTYLPNEEITDLIQISVPEISLNSTLQNHMRFAVDIYSYSVLEVKLQKSYISNPGEFSMFIQHGLQTDAFTQLAFVVYYLDRFNNFSEDAMTVSGFVQVRKQIQAPQIMGTYGTGYRWLFGHMPIAAERGNLNTPTFFTTVINPNNIQYKIRAELYNSNQALLETCGVIYPTTEISPRISEFIPSENKIAWRFAQELVPENDYYVILKITTIDDILITQSVFNENSKFIYSSSYQDKNSLTYWAPGTIIKADHLNTLNEYLRTLYKSYGYDEPVLFDTWKDEIIYATTNNNLKVVSPELKDPSVVEPTGVNLCPKFNQWLMISETPVITESDSQVLIDQINSSASSMFIPWKHRADTLKIAFTAIVNATDYEKLFQLDISFFDYYKNEIVPYHQTSMLVTPSQSELTDIGGSYVDGTELMFENIFNTPDSHLLSQDVEYIQITVSRYDSVEGLSSFSIKNAYMITDTAGSYSEYTTYDYSPVPYQHGSKQTAFDQLKAEFARLVDLIKADTLSTTIPFEDVPSIATPSYEVDSFITSAEDISNLSVEQNGIFGYLKVF